MQAPTVASGWTPPKFAKLFQLSPSIDHQLAQLNVKAAHFNMSGQIFQILPGNQESASQLSRCPDGLAASMLSEAVRGQIESCALESWDRRHRFIYRPLKRSFIILVRLTALHRDQPSELKDSFCQTPTRISVGYPRVLHLCQMVRPAAVTSPLLS